MNDNTPKEPPKVIDQVKPALAQAQPPAAKPDNPLQAPQKPKQQKTPRPKGNGGAIGLAIIVIAVLIAMSLIAYKKS